MNQESLFPLVPSPDEIDDAAREQMHTYDELLEATGEWPTKKEGLIDGYLSKTRGVNPDEFIATTIAFIKQGWLELDDISETLPKHTSQLLNRISRKLQKLASLPDISEDNLSLVAGMLKAVEEELLHRAARH